MQTGSFLIQKQNGEQENKEAATAVNGRTLLNPLCIRSMEEAIPRQGHKRVREPSHFSSDSSSSSSSPSSSPPPSSPSSQASVEELPPSVIISIRSSSPSSSSSDNESAPAQPPRPSTHLLEDVQPMHNVVLTGMGVNLCWLRMVELGAAHWALLPMQRVANQELYHPHFGGVHVIPRAFTAGRAEDADWRTASLRELEALWRQWNGRGASERPPVELLLCLLALRDCTGQLPRCIDLTAQDEKRRLLLHIEQEQEQAAAAAETMQPEEDAEPEDMQLIF